VADYTVTAANVKKQAGSTTTDNNSAGETITAGQSVRLDGTTNKWMKLDATAIEAATETIGIATHGALLDQPLVVITAGDIDMGSIGTIGVPVTAGTGSSGGLAPHTDLATNDYTIIMGYWKDADTLTVDIIQTGVLHG